MNLQKFSDWGFPIKNVMFIAGPCSTESPEQVMQTALALKDTDNRLLELLAKRMNNAKKIAFHKMSHDISLFQPDRFEEVTKKWISEGRNLSGDLSEEFIARLYHFIHEESLRVQEKVLSD